MFPYQPKLSQSFDNSVRISLTIKNDIGDLRQPWEDLGLTCNLSPFEAKVLFSIGMMRRYIYSANYVLQEQRYRGFLSAYGLLSSAIELLGRCVHPDIDVRQNPVDLSMKRLKAGYEFIKNPRLGIGVIVETSHYEDKNGGYGVDDLINLRNLSAHGACIIKVAHVKADIELLHNLRVLIYGVPTNENDPHLGIGPKTGAIDRYYQELTSGNILRCEQIASAAISPSPTQLQGGDWPFSAQIVNEINLNIQNNIMEGKFPISGDHVKSGDYFQLYP